MAGLDPNGPSKSSGNSGALSDKATSISGPTSKDRAKWGRNLACTKYEQGRLRGDDTGGGHFAPGRGKDTGSGGHF